MPIVSMFASPAVYTRQSIDPPSVYTRWSSLANQLRRKYFGTHQFSSRDLAVQPGRHHPCWKVTHFLPCTRPPDVDLLKLRSYFLSQLGPYYVRILKLPMYSEGHILSDPGLLATFFEGLLIRRALPLSTSSGAFSFILSILW
jgi:hypothetical protein